MCLTIDKKIHQDLQPLIADKPITVYKLFVKKYIFGRYIYSPIWDHKYKTYVPNKEIVLEPTTRTMPPTINAGYHSYKTIQDSSPIIFSQNCYKIRECEIPKGSKYFIGDNGDIVSSNIIIKGVIKNGT